MEWFIKGTATATSPANNVLPAVRCPHLRRDLLTVLTPAFASQLSLPGADQHLNPTPFIPPTITPSSILRTLYYCLPSKLEQLQVVPRTNPVIDIILLPA